MAEQKPMQNAFVRAVLVERLNLTSAAKSLKAIAIEQLTQVRQIE